MLTNTKVHIFIEEPPNSGLEVNIEVWIRSGSDNCVLDYTLKAETFWKLIQDFQKANKIEPGKVSNG